jgi:hypothetical protein
MELRVAQAVDEVGVACRDTDSVSAIKDICNRSHPGPSLRNPGILRSAVSAIRSW